MVKRYRPWTDHGDSAVLEEVDHDGRIPQGATDIHPDYDTRVVLASDYEALQSERQCLTDSWHSVCEAKSARIAALETALRRAQNALANTSPVLWRSLKTAIDEALKESE